MARTDSSGRPLRCCHRVGERRSRSGRRGCDLQTPVIAHRLPGPLTRAERAGHAAHDERTRRHAGAGSRRLPLRWLGSVLLPGGSGPSPRRGPRSFARLATGLAASRVTGVATGETSRTRAVHASPWGPRPPWHTNAPRIIMRLGLPPKGWTRCTKPVLHTDSAKPVTVRTVRCASGVATNARVKSSRDRPTSCLPHSRLGGSGALARKRAGAGRRDAPASANARGPGLPHVLNTRSTRVAFGVHRCRHRGRSRRRGRDAAGIVLALCSERGPPPTMLRNRACALSRCGAGDDRPPPEGCDSPRHAESHAWTSLESSESERVAPRDSSG